LGSRNFIDFNQIDISIIDEDESAKDSFVFEDSRKCGDSREFVRIGNLSKGLESMESN
jgi:hypothetical protein